MVCINKRKSCGVGLATKAPIYLACYLLAVSCSLDVRRNNSFQEDGAYPIVVGKEQRLPNVVYILADDLGYGDVGAYGQRKISTPNIDKLAEGGLLFTQHYSGSTVCAPSRASLLTGLHTGRTQIRGNYELGGYLDSEERGQMPLRPGTPVIGTMLKEVGYATAMIGKWGLGGPGSEGVPNNHGFDHFFGYLDQKQAHSYYPTHLWRNAEHFGLTNEYRHPHPSDIGVLVTSADYGDYIGEDYAPDLITAEAKYFIRGNAERPFLLYLSYPAPHAALQVPDSYVDAYQGQWDELPSDDNWYTPHPKSRAARAAMISHMDEDIGEIVTLVRELGLERKTLIIFASDNGPSYEGGADLDFFAATGGFRGTKRDLYEGGIRVPMIAYWPGTINSGRRTHHVSAFWDVMPTLAELTGAMPAQETDGISFLPTLLGEQGQQQHQFLYWEFHDEYKGQNGSQAIRMGNWKAVRLNGKDDPDAPIELYDLATDPSESNDVASENLEVVERAAAFMGQRQVSDIPEWNFAK